MRMQTYYEAKKINNKPLNALMGNAEITPYSFLSTTVTRLPETASTFLKDIPGNTRNWIENIKKLELTDSKGTYKLQDGKIVYNTLPTITEVKQKETGTWTKYLPYAVPIALFLLR